MRIQSLLSLRFDYDVEGFLVRQRFQRNAALSGYRYTLDDPLYIIFGNGYPT